MNNKKKRKKMEEIKWQAKCENLIKIIGYGGLDMTQVYVLYFQSDKR